MKRFQRLIKEARDGAPAWAVVTLSDEKVNRIVRQLAEDDVADILEWLDALSVAKDELPDWDGDSSDDIFRAQDLGARLIAALPDRLRPLAARGLRSPHEQTRTWVAIGLDRPRR